jgi:CheY-like chemotaxis protein
MVHELEIEKTIAEEGERAKTAFLANMSHELRTPINAVLGMNEMILRESNDPDIKTYAEKIKVAGRSLLEMVNDILKYSKKQADRKDVEAAEKLPKDKPKEESASKDTAKKEEGGDKKPYREKFTAPEAEVLAIDDTPMNLMVLKSLLKKTQIKIDTADSGDGGLDLSAKKKYDLLLFDHMMPEKDGIETLKELRLDESNPNCYTTAVCLTANAIPGAREFYIGAGFDDYLSKPVDPEKLEEMLLQYLPKDKVQKEAAPEAEPVKAAEEAAPEETVMFDGLSANGLIDVQKGIKNSGSADAYLPLLKIFYESMDDKARELEGYYTNGDIANYTIKVHALKSSARLVGAEDVGNLAQELENAGKSGDIEYIDNNHTALLKELIRLKDSLQSLIENEEQQTEKPEADEYIMEEVYSQIKEAAQDMDCETLEDILAEMEEYSIPENDAELYGKVKAAIGNYDYDGIAELLADK